MKFKKADDVRSVVFFMRDSDIRKHSFNRAKINELFDGFPPFSEEDAEINHVDTNVNFLEAPGLAHKARSTWNNAMLKPGNFFTVTLDSGPIHKRDLWSHTITSKLNRQMKKSLRYVETIRATGAQVVMHGIGPVWWEKSRNWCPKEVGLEDLLVPGGTKVNLENLSYFAIFRRYTPEELYRMTHGKNVDEGWNMEMVDKELRRVSSEIIGQQRDFQDVLSPEKLERYFKANSGFFDTDSVPGIDVWDFYFQEDEEDKCRWYRKMILANTEYEGEGFLYNPRRPFAGELSQILHIQFGDGANVAPFLYHAVRSLGFLLFAVCHLQNRLRCSFMDAILEATKQYFRVHSSEDRARIQKVDLVNLGLVPDGLEFVPRDQRWQVDEALVVAGLSQNRQLMAENAASYVQDIDQGTAKEQTAAEFIGRMNNANALVSSLLSMAYTYQQFQHMEIARRFTIEDSPDPAVSRFRLECLKAGIPKEYLNACRWDVEPERVMGGGNKTLEMAQAKALMEIAPQLDGSAQNEVKRDYVLAVTDNPDKALRLVPDTNRSVSTAEHDAQVAIGSLMNGAPVSVREGIDHIGYVEAFLISMKAMVDAISKSGMPTPMQIVGLLNCFQHVMQHIKVIGQDPQERQRVRRYGDFLKPIMNQVKAWGQQLDQAREAAQQEQQNANGAADMAKIQATVFQAQTKAKIAEDAHAGKERRSNAKLLSGEQRKNAQLAADMQRKNAQMATDLHHQGIQVAADVEAKDKLTAADIKAKRMNAEQSSEDKES